jgi:hypothetical protein
VKLNETKATLTVIFLAMAMMQEAEKVTLEAIAPRLDTKNAAEVPEKSVSHNKTYFLGE